MVPNATDDDDINDWNEVSAIGGVEARKRPTGARTRANKRQSKGARCMQPVFIVDRASATIEGRREVDGTDSGRSQARLTSVARRSYGPRHKRFAVPGRATLTPVSLVTALISPLSARGCHHVDRHHQFLQSIKSAMNSYDAMKLVFLAHQGCIYLVQSVSERDRLQESEGKIWITDSSVASLPQLITLFKRVAR